MRRFEIIFDSNVISRLQSYLLKIYYLDKLSAEIWNMNVHQKTDNQMRHEVLSEVCAKLKFKFL